MSLFTELLSSNLITEYSNTSVWVHKLFILLYFSYRPCYHVIFLIEDSEIENQNTWVHLDTLKTMGSNEALDSLLQLLFTTKKNKQQKQLHMLETLACTTSPDLRGRSLPE